MKHLPVKTYLYRELEQEFKNWLTILGYASSTARELPDHLREFFHYLEQHNITSLENITASQIKSFFVYLSERPNITRSGSLSPAYLNKYFQAITNFSKYLGETGKDTFTLTIDRLPIERNTGELLTIKEIKQLYQACDYTPLGIRDRAMISIFYGLGLRRSEAVNLDVSDILFRKQLVYIRKAKNLNERYVPIHENILNDLTTYLDYSRPLLLKCPCPALLISSQSRRIEGQTLALRLQQLAITADINKEISPHTLRHCIATHLLKQGMPLKLVSEFLGHTTLESTQIYTHLAEII